MINVIKFIDLGENSKEEYCSSYELSNGQKCISKIKLTRKNIKNINQGISHVQQLRYFHDVEELEKMGVENPKEELRRILG